MPLLTFLFASILSTLPGHPGPPLFVEIDANSGNVRISISAEQQAIIPWIGLRLPLPSPDFDPQIEERLAAGISRLLKDERALDLALDGMTVPYEIERVEILDMFGAGNPEPALRIELSAKTLRGAAPNRIEIAWGLFDRVEKVEKRVLPVLIDADGEFDLLRATEATPRVSWTRNGSPETAPDSSAPAKTDPRISEIAVESAAPPWNPSPLRSLLLAGTGVIALGALLFFRFSKPRIALASTLLLIGLTLGISLAITRHTPQVQRMDESAALQLFEDLHRNVYRAFDARSEEEIYAQLAACVHGPLLDDLYTQILRGLTIEEDGGALCRIESLTAAQGNLIDPELVPPRADQEAVDGFAVEWNWIVRGRVVHFGHEHQRANRHRARYGVQPQNGAWRITSFEALAHERLDLEDLIQTP